MKLDLHATFDIQVQNIIDKGYPEILNIPENALREKLQPLKAKLPQVGEIDIEAGKLPFVIVMKSPANQSEKLMSFVVKDGQPGFSKLFPHKAKDFLPVDFVTIPDGIAYSITNVDRGKESLNVAPDAALKMIQKENRSPLTIDEGIALITQYPAFLIKNNCYSLLASRYPGTKHVPAIWINAAKRPNLGWCWEGNPHTWLGSASCENRIGI